MKKIHYEQLNFSRCRRIFGGFLKKPFLSVSVFALSIYYLTILASAVYAGVRWTADGEAICTETNHQYNPAIASDGAGGAIITWKDDRGADSDVYAQRIGADGNVKWTANGVAICTAIDGQGYPTLVSDGAGGAIITWADIRSGINWYILAQRVDADGNVKWTPDGVPICTAAGGDYPAILSDGAGGAIITWADYRGAESDIYAQHIDANGMLLCTAYGVAVCQATGYQYNPAIASDGAGGAIITWADIRGADYDVYARRIDANGNVKWTADGVAICTAIGNQQYPTIVTDGDGGAIITWQDWRSGDSHIYAGRIAADGNVKWAANGVAICTALNNQAEHKIASDGAGGAIITWQDSRSGGWHIYAGRIDADGNVKWTANGEAICQAGANQWFPTIVSDGAGGAIITWQDQRSGGNWDIYAQRIGADGNVKWTADGVAICTAIDTQFYPTIASDGAGGAIITWQDQRDWGTTGLDVYAQRISNEPPQVISISPDSGDNDGTVDITNLAGTNFFTGPVVKLARSGSSDIQATNVVVAGPENITCRFDLTGKEIGKWNVIVTNTDEQSGSLSGVFEVEVGVASGKVRVQGGEKGYANPTKGEEVKIHFQAKRPGKVTIKIYTLRGQLVWEDSKQTDGSEDFIPWDCQNSEGSVVSSGVYVIYVKGPGIETRKKAAIVR